MQIEAIRDQIIASSAAKINEIKKETRRKLNALKVIGGDEPAEVRAENKGVTGAVRSAVTKMTGLFTASDVAARIKGDTNAEYSIGAIRSSLKWMELRNEVMVVERGVPRGRQTKYGVPVKLEDIPF